MNSETYVCVNRATCMYIFGYIRADVRIILKWVLQQRSQEMDSLKWFSH